jgi:hypothetical protein
MRTPLGDKLLFQFFYSLGAFDDEAQVIQLLFFGARREICRDTVERNVVAAEERYTFSASGSQTTSMPRIS